MREMCQTFGITALGETVESWTLENEFLTAEVLTYGATLRRLVFFLRQYLLGALPLEVVEAARIDGSGEFHTFNTIVLPIMKPALAVQAIFQFVANWNSLFLPSLIINSTGKKTLTMFVQMLMGESFRADYGVIFLALSITILPMFIMYFLLSRYIVEGVSLGSVKG